MRAPKDDPRPAKPEPSVMSKQVPSGRFKVTITVEPTDVFPDEYNLVQWTTDYRAVANIVQEFARAWLKASRESAIELVGKETH